MWKYSGNGLCFSYRNGSITGSFNGWLKDFQRDVPMRNEKRYGCVPLLPASGKLYQTKRVSCPINHRKNNGVSDSLFLCYPCSRQQTLECQTSEIPVSTWTRHNTTDHVTHDLRGRLCSLRWHLPKIGWYIYKQPQGTFYWLWNRFNLILMASLWPT